MTLTAFDDATGSEVWSMSTNWLLERLDGVFGTLTLGVANHGPAEAFHEGDRLFKQAPRPLKRRPCR